MAVKTCPKCNKKSEDATQCQHCGINFDQYETAKQEKLIEVRVLLSENKYKEAKELAEKLPSEFPDNRTDFLLLLSNINRDISIVDKYDLAKKAYDEGEFSQATLLLRNIKAFDYNLNEKVISLRRKAERHLQNADKFTKAVEAFDSGKYAEARNQFQQIHGYERQEEVADYLARINDVIGAMFDEAVECIRRKQFDVAHERFISLQSMFPDMQPQIEKYLTLLTKRLEIKNSIFNAAKQAKKDKRLLESKILYSYLGSQFPEFQLQVKPHLDEIGKNAVISLADLEESMLIDLASLGLETGGEGQRSLYAATDSKEYVAPDVITPDADKEGQEDIDSVISNRENPADTLSAPIEIDEEGVPDFVWGSMS